MNSKVLGVIVTSISVGISVALTVVNPVLGLVCLSINSLLLGYNYTKLKEQLGER